MTVRVGLPGSDIVLRPLRLEVGAWRGVGVLSRHQSRSEQEPKVTLEVSRLQKERSGGGPERVARVTLCGRLILTHELY